VVDDNVDAAVGLGELLIALGHDARVAHDGPQALRDAQHFDADIALIDVGLPIMDGCELAQRLRAQRAGGPLRLVAVTGYGVERDRGRSAAAGLSDHLVKPISR
jgi:CheY-like chemotaxis protein